MKIRIKRAAVSFAISSFMGLLVNLLIDLCVNTYGRTSGFISISPWFADLFATPVIAAYVNVLLYGVIGATFAVMTFVFEIDRLGFVLQYGIYFCSTSVVLAFITGCLWKLQAVPVALISTIAGYGLSFVIMGMIQYRKTREDVNTINACLKGK